MQPRHRFNAEARRRREDLFFDHQSVASWWRWALARVAAPLLIEIPNLVYHGFKCVSDHEAMVINFTTETYDYQNPDEFRLDPHTKDIPYDWNRKDG